MLTLIIIALLFWLLIAVVRSSSVAKDAEKKISAPEEMVRDALTGIYFPKNEAISINKGGEVFYFINVENRDRFLTTRR